MIALAKTMAPSDRMVWFDANRVMAAFGVVLIHCSTDAGGRPFSDASAEDRVVPVLIRTVAELSGSEMFFVFSLFLLAFKLDRRRSDYGSTIRDQAQRLLIPFVFWTVFYAFYRILKADAFGYAPAIWDQLSQWQSWLKYFLLGAAQYHLHFLPTLFAIILFYPVMRAATRYPLIGLALFGLLGAMDYVQSFIWSAVQDALLRDYLLRAVKILGYIGYGLAAFAIYGFWKDGLPRGEARVLRGFAVFLAAFALLTTLPQAFAAIETGQWPVRQGWAFYAHFLMPIFVLVCFMGSQYSAFSPRLSRAARYTFGIYLVHPLLIDLYDIGLRYLEITLSPTAQLISKFILVAPAALGLAYLLARLPILAWTVGLGPVPWSHWGASPKPQRRD